MNIETKKCWQCGSRAKWRWSIYWIGRGFHSDIYLCNKEECHKEFEDNNRDKFTIVNTFHNVN